MKKLLIALALLPVGYAPAYGQTPTPVSSAYEGNVGDWALGRWTGVRYADSTYSSLTTEERVLTVARLADGKVGCQCTSSADPSAAQWATQCVVTAGSITVRTPQAHVELDRHGAELDGRYVSAGTRFKVHMKRVATVAK
ncbi:hypothetical protein [Reyranella sp.]|uniref:hypothetical protein n=1 Tax=Reyranella sp. TaxID=1929291 RepID=UPI0012E99FBB